MSGSHNTRHVAHADLNKNGETRRKFTQQLQENEMVLQVGRAFRAAHIPCNESCAMRRCQKTRQPIRSHACQRQHNPGRLQHGQAVAVGTFQRVCSPNLPEALCAVAQELDQTEDASGVFKLIGPVLIRQDPIEVCFSSLHGLTVRIEAAAPACACAAAALFCACALLCALVLVHKWLPA